MFLFFLKILGHIYFVQDYNFLQEKNIPGTDIVELCPQYDNGATSSIAAKIMSLVIAINHKK